jgi:subtilisin-like proprotein convertase family protein
MPSILGLPALGASSDHRPAGRFDDRLRQREGGRIAVASRSPESLDPADGLRLGWERFRDRHGPWRIRIDERTGMPVLASGPGIPWFPAGELSAVNLERLEQRARTFLAGNALLLSDPGARIGLDRAASTRLGAGHWQLIFRQVVDGVRVENARLDLHVKHGRLVMFGATHWGTAPATAVPTLDAGAARDALDAYLGIATAELEPVGEPELALRAVDPAPAGDEPRAWSGPRGEGLAHALFWRLRFREPGRPAQWVAEVDAHDGTIRAFYDGTHYGAVRGGVFPISNDGDCLDGGCEIDGFPMPFADYTESGQPETFADGYGNLVCVEPAAQVATTLIGPYARIVDACGPLLENGACDAGVDLGLKRGENCDVEPGASAGNTSAARNAYYHINRVAEAARFYDPTNTWLQDQLTVNVNIGSTCNAFWDGEINMYGEGGGCGNTGELHGILVHEWGHGYDENDGGGFDITSEAYADVVAMFAARDSCMGRGTYNDGQTCSGYGDTCLTCTGFREFDWAARANNTPTTPENFVLFCPGGGGGPCGKESHCESYPISEAIYDFATRDLPAAGLDPDTAWQLAERLWYETRPGSGGDIYDCFRWDLTHSCFATHWYQRMLVADDDDGDLSNGTPHAAELFAAFDRHAISCGRDDDPENQSTTSCPTLDAPVLALAETPSGTELSWAPVAGADAYRVYRGELGCARQQVPIASLAGDATTFLDGEADPDLPRYYRIEAFGTNPVCHSPVSSCESTPLAARLQMEGHRVVESGADVNGIPDPGETVALPVSLFNSGLDDAVGTMGRLRLADGSQGRVLEPGATWAAIVPSNVVESDDPHFELTVFETVQCGESLLLELDASAPAATPAARAFEITLGERDRDFLNDQGADIPPQTVTPVTSTLVVDESDTLSELDVSIDIRHDATTELIVELTSPSGTTVRLHDGTDDPFGINTRYDLDRLPDGPGAMQDFAGEPVEGTWTLSIEDTAAASTGANRLEAWTLHATVEGAFGCEQLTCPEPTPTEAPDGLIVEIPAGGGELDLAFSWNPVAASGYHLLQSADPSFAGGVELTGRTSGATALTAPVDVPTPGPTFFQVRAVNTCNQEGP